MSKMSIRQVWQTKDGSVFPTKEAAEIHQRKNKRVYKVIEMNFRYKDGSHAPVPSTVIESGIDWYGDGWWHDGGSHKPGDGFVSEFETNRECQFMVNGQEFTGLMDVLSFSYDVKE